MPEIAHWMANITSPVTQTPSRLPSPSSDITYPTTPPMSEFEVEFSDTNQYQIGMQVAKLLEVLNITANLNSQLYFYTFL
jgi:hypothetical protein